jgi:predicted transcriptional regulator of viral defense system
MSLKGIGKLSRQRLAQVLRYAKGYITAKLVATCLNIPLKKAQYFLASWAKRGWLSRLRYGIYLPVDISAESSDEVLVDPWKIAAELFNPCYVSGWSAAEHWNLTEQIFETTVILTTKPVYKKQYVLNGARFLLKKISDIQMFGMQIIWKDQLKIHVADLHKTILDMLDDPSLGGGILSVTDFLQAYLSSPESNFQVLIEYAVRLKNKTIFKRLGF